MIRYLAPALLCSILVPGVAQGPGKEDRAKVLLEQLGSPDYEARVEAARKLEELGKAALPLLEKAVKSSDDPELRWQARRLVRKLQDKKLQDKKLQDKTGQGEKAEKSDKLERDDKPRRRGDARDGAEREGRRRRFRFPETGWRIDGFDGADLFEDIQKQIDRAMKGRDVGRLFGSNRMRDFKWDFTVPQGGQGKSVSKSVKIEIGPEGVRVETSGGKDGKKDRKVYRADDMDALLKKHPELKKHLGGVRVGRGELDFDDFGKDMRKRMARLRDLPGLKGFDFDMDFGRSGLETESIEKQIDEARARLEELMREFRRLEGAESRRGAKKDRVRDLRGKGAKLERDDVVKLEDVTNDGPRLGIWLREGLSPAVRDYLDLDDNVGLWVDRVQDGSIAAKAGLRSGDIVTKLDGKWISSPAAVQEALRGAGKSVRVEWIRKGRTMKKTVAN